MDNHDQPSNYNEVYDDNNNNNNTSNELLDDDYLIQLHRDLLRMKEERRRAERDAALMDNRVRCLKSEKEKTDKKIAVIRRKHDTRVNAQQQMQDKKLQKEQFRLQKELEIEQRKEELNKQRKEKLIENEQKQIKLQNKLNENIKNRKEEKNNNMEIRRYLEEEDRSNKVTQANYIKNQHILAEEKRRAAELEKKNRIKLELINKITEEEERIQLAGIRKQQLEEEESEIIAKLKTTTRMHEEAVEKYNNLSQEHSAKK
jgi:hypothetical protein